MLPRPNHAPGISSCRSYELWLCSLHPRYGMWQLCMVHENRMHVPECCALAPAPLCREPRLLACTSSCNQKHAVCDSEHPAACRQASGVPTISIADKLHAYTFSTQANLEDTKGMLSFIDKDKDQRVSLQVTSYSMLRGAPAAGHGNADLFHAIACALYLSPSSLMHVINRAGAMTFRRNSSAPSRLLHAQASWHEITAILPCYTRTHSLTPPSLTHSAL